MAELSLITDRTAADVAAGNDKGYYNASDLNRVGKAVQYLADVFHGLGYGFSVSPKTDWKETDWPTASTMAQYLQDIATLRGLLEMLKTTPEAPHSMENLTHTTANDIEKILLDVEDTVSRIQAAMLYAGEIYSGEV